MKESVKPEKSSLIKKLADGYKSLSGREKVCFYLCCFVLVIIGLYIFVGIRPSVNSDSLTSIVYAREMIRTNSIMPPQWINFSGSEIFVWGMHSIVVVLSLFIQDQLLIFSICGCIFYVASICAIIYCTKVVCKNNCWLIILPVLFCGISEDYDKIVYIQLSYLPQILEIFLIIALFIDSLDDEYYIKSNVKFTLSCALMIIYGFNGVKAVQLIGLPLLGSVIVAYIIRNNKEKNYSDIIKSKQFKSLLFKILFVVLSIILGFIGFKLFLSLQPTRKSLPLEISVDFSESLENMYNYIVLLFGVSNDVSIFSIKGIFSAVKIVCGILLLIIFPALQIRNFKNENSEMQMFTIYATLHIIELLFLGLFTKQISAIRYLYSGVFLLWFLSAHYIYTHFIKDKMCIKNLITVLSLVALVIPCVIPKAIAVIDYSDNMQQRRTITDFLIDNDLSYGYASYWNSIVNTGVSDFAVTVNPVNINPLSERSKLYSTYYYTEEAYQGESFLMLTESENETFLESEAYINLGSPSEVLENSGFIIYVYDYNIANNNFKGIITEEIEIAA